MHNLYALVCRWFGNWHRTHGIQIPTLGQAESKFRIYLETDKMLTARSIMMLSLPMATLIMGMIEIVNARQEGASIHTVSFQATQFATIHLA